MARTRAELRGIKLPFHTVDEALAFGRKRVEEYRQEQQAKQVEQMEEMAAKGMLPQGQGFYNFTEEQLAELGVLNFNDFLEEYESEVEKNLGVNQEELGQNSNMDLANKQDKNLDAEEDRELEDNFDLDDSNNDSDLDNDGPGDDSKKKKNTKKHTITKSKSKSRTDKASKKSITVSRNQQRNNRDRAASLDSDKDSMKKKGIASSREQQEKAQQRTKKVIVSRNTEVIAKDDKGQNITRQVEKVQDKAIGDKGNGLSSPAKSNKPMSLADKIAEAKLTISVDSMLDNAARLTHQTGRSTEFKIGNDVLKFEKIGEDTFAMKNGEKIPGNEAKDMLKQMGRDMGPRRLEQLVQIVKVAQQNPTIRTMSQSQGKEQANTEKIITTTTHTR